ncbi:hypothetical protein T310_8926 [Rasamsonia emersonii CBS 393.64]|uniref:Uncharacterized protein n=1 Tax=Rasamsonia emersonii (strain ATCC 16479 / CBS 393.64 / IMI 116815) TaxID=1408163 RepID=A0A0F4YGB9_RASE3|nr:hypothetical protein T310_8926 [Rasamsonia emersonii CBS 393.64]KKA17292.1 hypothetical protein T310_8926 [Rasamsonia emersonii CBS 393.64]
MPGAFATKILLPGSNRSQPFPPKSSRRRKRNPVTLTPKSRPASSSESDTTPSDAHTRYTSGTCPSIAVGLYRSTAASVDSKCSTSHAGAGAPSPMTLCRASQRNTSTGIASYTFRGGTSMRISFRTSSPARISTLAASKA